jgi:hypothetical protein
LEGIETMVSRSESGSDAEDADFRVDPHLVIMTIEPLTPAAKAWIVENTEAWQWQDDRLCVESAIAPDILSRIALAGLSCEGALIDIPDEYGSRERLLQERNWVRVMQQTMPEGVPRRDDAIAVIDQALHHIGCPIQ